MSNSKLTTLVSCVETITSAYLEGVRLVQKIQAKRKTADSLQNGAGDEGSLQELEQSLHQGETTIRTQYDRNFRRFGNSFAMGDRESLQH